MCMFAYNAYVLYNVCVCVCMHINYPMGNNSNNNNNRESYPERNTSLSILTDYYYSYDYYDTEYFFDTCTE